MNPFSTGIDFALKPAAAIEFLRQKGMVISWNWYDQWKDAHSRAFTVAKVAKLDLLQDIYDSLLKATEQGQTYEQWSKELKPTLAKKGWLGTEEIVDEKTGLITKVEKGTPRRLRTIYENNLQTQYSAGRWQGQQVTMRVRPYGQYIAVMDAQTTAGCAKLDGRIFRLDDPVWNYIYPPNHFGCRSTVRTLSDRQVERMGLTVESSQDRIITQRVPVGGKEVTVYGLKIDDQDNFFPGAGWDYNPGAVEWKPDLSKYDEELKTRYLQDSSRKE